MQLLTIEAPDTLVSWRSDNDLFQAHKVVQPFQEMLCIFRTQRLLNHAIIRVNINPSAVNIKSTVVTLHVFTFSFP